MNISPYVDLYGGWDESSSHKGLIDGWYANARVVQQDNASSLFDEVAAIKSAGGGVLIVPDGNYVIGEPLKLPNNIILVGFGKNTTIKFANNVDPTEKGVIMNEDTVNGNNDIEIRGILADANGANNAGSGYGMYYKNVTDGKFIDCYGTGGFGSSGGGHGMGIYSGERIAFIRCHGYDNGRHGLTTTSGPSWVEFTDSYAYSNGQQGIHTSTGSYITVQGCKAYGNATDGFQMTNATESSWVNCISRNNGFAGFRGLIGSKIMSSCWSLSNGREGVLIDTTSNSAGNTSIIGNYILNNGYEGIKIEKPRDVIIKDNKIEAPDSYDGILLTILPTSGSVYEGYHIKDNILEGSANKNSINLDTDGFNRIIITGNDAPSGINVAGAPTDIVQNNNLT